MKKLNELYECEDDTLIKGIKINSKEITPGDLFVCTMGVNFDRHDYIDDAISKGASALIVSKDVKVNIPTIKVENTNKELISLTEKFYDKPNEKLKMIGVTGTDGKTTVSTIISTILNKFINCGYIGTNGRSCKKIKKDTDNTTPDVDKLYPYLQEFVENDCKCVTMEVSSEGLYRNRVGNILYDIAVITNITSEHLNIHKTLENYIEAKSSLFKKLKKYGYAILNIDDKYYQNVYKCCTSNVITYGKNKEATYHIYDINLSALKTTFKLKYLNKEYLIETNLVGEFNVYNLTAAIASCVSYGIDINEVLKYTNDLKIDGRMEVIKNDLGFTVIVDYAHTPNGIENLFAFINQLNKNKTITVIGSAGERDRTKRPIMGEVITRCSNHTIFTYEDPRSEDVIDIINDLISTIKDSRNNYEIVLDRKEAIKKAFSIANKDDVILVLGKGNETYQKLKHETIYFNDIKECENNILEMKGKISC